MSTPPPQYASPFGTDPAQPQLSQRMSPQATCEMMHDEFIKKENEMCDMMVESYVSGRDMIVNFADMAVNKINDRTGAETMIDAEFDMIMEIREGEWLEEFNYMWESEMNKEEEESMEEV